MDIAKLVIPFLLLLLAVFWARQVLSLMSMKDEDFPGRYDKPIWAALMILTLFVGAVLFWWWKPLFLRRKLARRTDTLRKDLDSSGA